MPNKVKVKLHCIAYLYASAVRCRHVQYLYCKQLVFLCRWWRWISLRTICRAVRDFEVPQCLIRLLFIFYSVDTMRGFLHVRFYICILLVTDCLCFVHGAQGAARYRGTTWRWNGTFITLTDSAAVAPFLISICVVTNDGTRVSHVSSFSILADNCVRLSKLTSEGPSRGGAFAFVQMPRASL